MSQSLLPQTNPNGARVTTALSQVDLNASKGQFVKPRGRSLTRREDANKDNDRKRTQSAKPRGPRPQRTPTDRGSLVHRPPSNTRNKAPNSRSASRVRYD